MKGGNESAARSEKLLEQTIEISSQTLNSLRKQERLFIISSLLSSENF